MSGCVKTSLALVLGFVFAFCFVIAAVTLVGSWVRSSDAQAEADR
jgi:hypothetical protein